MRGKYWFLFIVLVICSSIAHASCFVDVQPSACDGEFVDVHVFGVFNVDYLNSDFSFTDWYTECLLAGSRDYTIEIDLFEEDWGSADDFISDFSGLFTTTKYPEGGQCAVIEFDHVFEDIRLSDWAGGTEGSTIELFAVCEGNPADELTMPIQSSITQDVDIINGQCGGGSCCDLSTCNFHSSSFQCGEDVSTDYGCPWGTSLGDDVGVHHQDQFCSGTSNACTGSLVWDDWSVNDDCGSNERCVDDNPSCQQIACSSESECGSDGLTGSTFCTGDDVYQDYRDYSCINPGSPSSYCTFSDTPQLVQSCVETCLGGQCVGIACDDNLDCGSGTWIGSPSCHNDDVWQDYRDHFCLNPGTAQASCITNDTYMLKSDCPDTCSSGSCVGIDCYSNSDCGSDGYVASPVCDAGDVWQDYRTYTCSNPGTTSSSCSYSDNYQLKESCPESCSSGSCSGFVCYDNDDCGTDGYVGSGTCVGDDVWQDYRTYTCNNPGTASASCSHSDVYQLRYNCPDMCVSGSCASVACHHDIQCPSDEWIGSPYCNQSDSWQVFRDHSCINPGTTSSFCAFSDFAQIKQFCGENCVNGLCEDFACNVASDCGPGGWINSPVCIGSYSVFQWNRAWSCIDGGTPNSSCVSDDIFIKSHSCSDDCEDGYCVEPGYFWFTKSHDSTIHKYYRNGTYLLEFDAPSYDPTGIAWDGSYLWVADKVEEMIYKLTSSGIVVDSFSSPGPEPDGLTWYDGNLWVVDYVLERIFKLDPNGTVLDSYFIDMGPRALVVNDSSFIVTLDHNDRIGLYNRSADQKRWVFSPRSQPYGLATDGHVFWHLDYSRRLYKFSFSLEEIDYMDMFYWARSIAFQPEHESVNCYFDSDCGSGSYVGQSYCNGSDVYQVFRNYSCSDPASNVSSCSFADQPVLVDTCVAGCVDGSCRDLPNGTFWISDPDNYSIRNIDLDGNVLSSFDLPQQPSGVEWDGMYLWVAGVANRRVFKYTVDGLQLSNFSSFCLLPIDIVKRGSYLWHSCADGDIYITDLDGSLVSSIAAPGTIPGGITWNGSHYLNADFSSQKIFTLNSSGHAISNVDSEWPILEGLTWDGDYLWSCEYDYDKVHMLDSNASIVFTFNVSNSSVFGIAYTPAAVSCSSDSVCGDDHLLGGSFCAGSDLFRMKRDFSCENPGTTSSYCSFVDSPMLVEECDFGCSNDSCSSLVCGLDSDCGTDGFVGNDFCGGGHVVRDFRSFTCNNPGTGSAYCSFSDSPQVVQSCPDGCFNASCTFINCSFNYECGDEGWIGSKYCHDDNIWQDYEKYICNNKGTPSSFCSVSDSPKLRRECDDGCSDGICISSECSTDSDCGDDEFIGNLYCRDSDVWKDFRSWSCLGSGSDAYCLYSDQETLVENCSVDCLDGACVGVSCVVESECGDEEWVGANYCNGSDIYRNFRNWNCSAGLCEYNDIPIYSKTCQYGCSHGRCLDDEGHNSGVSDLGLDYLLLQFPDTIYVGTEANIGFTITNHGQDSLSDIEWRLDSGSSTMISGVVSNLDVGESTTIFKKLVYSTPNVYTVEVVVDPFEKIDEFDEYNNNKSILVQVI